MDFKVPTYRIVQLEHLKYKPTLKHKNPEKLCNRKNGDTLLLQKKKKAKSFLNLFERSFSCHLF